MATVDWLIILAYFGMLAGLTWWVIQKSRDTADDYFLAGRNLGWGVIGASIFASNIGSEHIVGLAGSGATSGVAMAHYELHAWCLLVLAWVFVPFYMRSMVFTMPEFLERRFSTESRYVLSIVSLITFVISKIAVGIFARSEHIVGLAGSGATSGVAMAHYELHAWCLLVLAWVFVPFYMRSMVFTMPEFLERRFSTESRYVLSIVSLITFVISKIAVGIFA